MRTITEEIIIHATSEKIWYFITNLHLDNSYKRWHPSDHIAYYLRKGNMGEAGGIAYFVERIGKFTFRLFYKTTKANYPSYLEYKAAPPLSWLYAGKGTFTLEAVGAENTRFIAYVEYGYDVPIIGKIVDWLIERIVKYDDARKHVREEGENIKKLLE